MAQTVLIKLNPKKLVNPDLDLRYCLPDRIEEASQGFLCDNGYDYLEQGDYLGIWLRTEAAEAAYPMVVTLLENEQFLGNDLSQSAELYISAEDTADLEQCRKVHPTE